ncbi:hypothetical protein TgHK011_007127 [Trichoderma gracile]|nr:hypothetical protein TgHK011_007127 [Trichoderma gracile]
MFCSLPRRSLAADEVTHDLYNKVIRPEPLATQSYARLVMRYTGDAVFSRLHRSSGNRGGKNKKALLT